jgi:endonuclease YncB( thermonuclease family)
MIGTKSKEYLFDLLAGQQVTVDWHMRDRYHVIVGKIIRNRRDVDLKMVRAVPAWWCHKHANEQSAATHVL